MSTRQTFDSTNENNIIHVDFSSGKVLSRTERDDKQQIITPTRRTLSREMLSPAEAPIQKELAQEHAAEPIKRIEDIERLSKHLIQQKHYRDNMLFIVGINLGLRVSDLVTLRFSDLINEDFSFKTTFPLLEKKTKNTRKVKKNRYLTINDAVMDAVELFLKHSPSKLDDYMFRSESNRGGNQNQPLTTFSVERILKKAASEIGLECHVSTHTLRKTFGYHQMMMGGNDPRRLLLLQKIFGHSSVAQTLDYIGITGEEIQEAYLGLNLGSSSCYAKQYRNFSSIQELG